MRPARQSLQEVGRFAEVLDWQWFWVSSAVALFCFLFSLAIFINIGLFNLLGFMFFISSILYFCSAFLQVGIYFLPKVVSQIILILPFFLALMMHIYVLFLCIAVMLRKVPLGDCLLVFLPDSLREDYIKSTSSEIERGIRSKKCKDIKSVYEILDEMSNDQKGDTKWWWELIININSYFKDDNGDLPV